MKRRELLANVLSTSKPSKKEDDLKPKKSGPRANYFPNFLLRTHEGKQVRFYDDLIHGKHVVINMMYADCKGLCPPITANLVKVQELLKDRIGKDIFMYSITLQPDVDTPKALNEYAKMHHVKPGWTFLTGRAADIDVIRRKLGFVDLDPVLDKDTKSHIGLLRIGNELTDMWIATPGISKPKNVIKRILWLETPADFKPDNGSTQTAKPASEKKK